MKTIKMSSLKNVELMNTTQAAEFLGLSWQTLNTHRSRGSGPTYLKAPNGRIAYRKSDLETYARSAESDVLVISPIAVIRANRSQKIWPFFKPEKLWPYEEKEPVKPETNPVNPETSSEV